MNVRSLFSGAGGLDLGLERAGLRVISQCEKDPWRRRVLASHWPDIPCAENVVDLRSGVMRDAESRHPDRHSPLARLDGRVRDQPRRDTGVLCGGFPCQDLSVAGRRAGLNGDRSGLFFEFARVADELQPRWLLVENVPGLLSSADGRDFAVVLSTLADLGYGVAWRVLDARYFGVPQRRRRVFIVGCAGGDPGPAVRALGAGGGGDLEAGACSWQRATRRIGGGAGDPRRDHAACLTANERWDLDTETFVVSPLRSPGDGGTGLNAEMAAGGQLVVNALDRQAGGPDDNAAQAGHLIAAPLTRGSATGPGVNEPGRRQEDDVNLVAAGGSNGDAPVQAEADALEALRGVWSCVGAQTVSEWEARVLRSVPAPEVLRSLLHGGGVRQATQAGAGLDDGALPRQATQAEGFLRAVRELAECGRTPPERRLARQHAGELAATLSRLSRSRSSSASGVRRLTPREAERLMSWPDSWTAVDGARTPDSRRYAACGDGVVSNVAEWIGRRLVAVDRGLSGGGDAL